MSARLICGSCEKEFQLSDENCPNCGQVNPVFQRTATAPEVTPKSGGNAHPRSKKKIVVVAAIAIVVVAIFVIVRLATGGDHLKGAEGLLVDSDSSPRVMVYEYPEIMPASLDPEHFDKRFSENPLDFIEVKSGTRAKVMEVRDIYMPKFKDSSRYLSRS